MRPIPDTTHFRKCLHTLESAWSFLKKASPESTEYEIYRLACVKEFELILEQSGRLIKKKLSPYYANPSHLDRLYFKDLFREAHLRGIVSEKQVENWFRYRDSRNTTAHEYGALHAEATLGLLESFIVDAISLADQIDTPPHAS